MLILLKSNLSPSAFHPVDIHTTKDMLNRSALIRLDMI